MSTDTQRDPPDKRKAGARPTTKSTATPEPPETDPQMATLNLTENPGATQSLLAGNANGVESEVCTDGAEQPATDGQTPVRSDVIHDSGWRTVGQFRARRILVGGIRSGTRAQLLQELLRKAPPADDGSENPEDPFEKAGVRVPRTPVQPKNSTAVALDTGER